LLVSIALGLGFFPMYNQDCQSSDHQQAFHGENYTLAALPDQNTGSPPICCPKIPSPLATANS
jgi:hypothetical protein